MVQIRRYVLTLALTLLLLESASGGLSQKFFPDDPIQVMPPPLSINPPAHRKLDPVSDFLANSTSTETPPPTPAGAINTLGEVPDSEWFTNRHARHRLSPQQLVQSGNTQEPPVPPFTVIGGKTDGITPGFRMQDAKGRRYFVKGDPLDAPEMATAADVIVSRFMYAIGYNTPYNEIVNLKVGELQVSGTAKITVQGGKSRDMNWNDIEDFLHKIHKSHDGTYRVIASRAVEGEGIGPFKFEDTRPDDPNDVTPHQNRRDLRGLYVISAWVNNTDVKADNSLDTIVEENGCRFIRHYLIDFGSALGSDGDRAKDPRFGHEYIIATPTEAAKRVFMLGLAPKDWERVDFPKLRGIGNLDAASFEPDRWTSDFPNPAFLSRLPDDDFWAAKQVMAFTNDDIRVIVDTGRLSSPVSADYMASILAQRRDMIGRTFFLKILPVDNFRVEKGELLFDDLAVRYGFHPPRRYKVQWSRFNNVDQKHEPIAGADSAMLPAEAMQAVSGSYFSATINTFGNRLKPASIYVRKEANGFKVVGIDRSW